VVWDCGKYCSPSRLNGVVGGERGEVHKLPRCEASSSLRLTRDSRPAVPGGVIGKTNVG
jgi:hypothetical protein